MYEHHVPALNDQRRHQFMADADARRLVNAARDVEMPAPALPDTIWAEGTLLRVRPIVSTDADRLTRLFARLSPRSVQARFFSPIRRIPRWFAAVSWGPRATSTWRPMPIVWRASRLATR